MKSPLEFCVACLYHIKGACSYALHILGVNVDDDSHFRQAFLGKTTIVSHDQEPMLQVGQFFQGLCYEFRFYVLVLHVFAIKKRY